MKMPSHPAASAAARQHRSERRVPGGGVARASGPLHRMRRIEDHVISSLAQPGERAHIGDEIVVAKCRAALGKEKHLRAERVQFLGDVAHIPGREELAFLTFTTRPVSAAARMRSVWRQRKAGICRTSMNSAAISASLGEWTSVVTGMPISRPISPNNAQPSRAPRSRDKSAPKCGSALS